MSHRAFSVGVLRIRWLSEPPVASRLGGRVLYATLTEIDTPGGTLRRDYVHAALIGAVVVSPDDRLSRVVDVESPATLGLAIGVGLSLLVEDV